MNTSQQVLVYGATGSQAHPLVFKLLERGHIPFVLTRHPDKAADLKAAGARIVIGSLDNLPSLKAASEGIDVAALLIPAFLEKPWEAAQYARNAIDAANAVGVKRLVWNMSGPLYPERSGNPMNDLRIDTLEALRASRIAHITFEPTVYMENLLGPWTAEAIMQRNQVAYPILRDKKVGWLASEDLAALVLAAIERPELDGQHFKISGIEAPTGPELAQIFGEVLQRDLTYYQMAPEEIGAVIDRMAGPGAGDAVADEYRRQQNDPHPLPAYHDMTGVLDKLPVQMTTIREWIARRAYVFIPTAEPQK
jgi:uncharacterized protein YbjT (DUF2867 family)